MDKDKILIVFGEDWGRFPSSTQHIVTSLLKLGWNVVWINSVGLRKPSFTWSYVKRIFEKLYQYIFSKSKTCQSAIPKHLTVINPMILPLIGYSFIDTCNRKILEKQLSFVIKKMGASHPVIWMTLPTAYPFHLIFKGSPLVYYCCDDYSLITSPPNPTLSLIEAQLVARADLVLVSSEVLYEKMPPDKTSYFDHGIDLELFTKPFDRPADLPEGKPIAGFYGSLSHWVDYNLLYACASQLPDWNFVLIGILETDMAHLLSLSNVFYLGPKPYHEIPAYSQHWQTSLIPFIKNPLVHASNPLKVKEYLACKNPIVSVYIPSVLKYNDCIYIAKNDHDFIRGIALSLNDHNQGLRIAHALKESWDNKAMELEQKLMALLAH